jgi:molybdopterin-biosynthesis enzyme MoeA-like protein
MPQELKKIHRERVVSMLRSQFSAILPIFCEKIGVFEIIEKNLKDQCYDQIFAKVSCKPAIFLPNFEI